MKKTRLVIWILNIILLACIFVKVFYVSDKQMILSADDSAIFKITINVDGCKREIHPWHDADKDRLIFFVPGNIKDSTVYLDGNIFGKPLVNGKNTIDIEQEAEITLTSNGNSYQAAFIRGSQIPSLFIETSSGSMDTIHSDKQNRERDLYYRCPLTDKHNTIMILSTLRVMETIPGCLIKNLTP